MDIFKLHASDLDEQFENLKQFHQDFTSDFRTKTSVNGGLKIPISQFLVTEPNIVINVRNGGMANTCLSANLVTRFEGTGY